MRKTPVRPFLLGALALLLAALFAGCHRAPMRTAADSRLLQGYWEGHGPGGECSVTISGNSLHFRARLDFWYETTFTIPAVANPQQLHATIIKDSSQRQRDIGKVVVALFKIEDGTLTFGVIDDFEGPLASPVTDDWDRAIDRYYLTRVQPQESKPNHPQTSRPKTP